MRFAIASLIGLFALVSSGQAAPVSANKECSFEFRKGLIWLTVTSSQSPRPLRFLLDTGASVSVLNSSTVDSLKLRRGRPVRVKGVEAAATGYWPQRLAAEVGEIALPEEFLAVDLSELSRACTCRIDGLVGADFFRERVVQIDFVSQKIRFPECAELSTNSEIASLRVTKNSLRCAVEINGGKPTWLRLDTGCASSLEWVTGKVRSEFAWKSTCIGLSETSIPQISTSVRLAKTTLSNIATGVHRRRIFPGEDGLLGNGILSRFSRVTVDARHNRLILDPR
jgi:hypothetical protein